MSKSRKKNIKDRFEKKKMIAFKNKNKKILELEKEDEDTEEEIEEVVNVVGKDTVITGFYSYGEIAPFYKETNCQLHNQTMTITLISE